ncbi:MAG: M23 family metallopeptidase [Patescibacteria group bacterium]|nr:MAG: M23 family metallopeptidase [Patescibacteria group bacterium]
MVSRKPKYFFAFLFAAFFILATFFPPSGNIQAGLMEDLRERIEERNTKIDEIEKEIASYQREISELSGQAVTLKNSIRTLDVTRKKLGADIRITQNQINATVLKIQKLGLEVEQKEEEITRSDNAIADIIREVDEAETRSLVEVILSNDTFSAFLDEVETLRRLQGSVSRRLGELESLKAQLEDAKEQNEAEKVSLVDFRTELGDRKKIADNNKATKRRLLTTTKNKESNYKKLLAEKKVLRETFERELLEIESQLRAVIDPNSIPSAGSGIFAPPLSDVAYKSCYDGSTKAKNCITQYFGDTPFAKSGAYNGKTHNGMDLRARTPQKVRAVLGGTVVRVNSGVAPNCQYGKWVVIKHNNGLTTLYAHMSLIKARAGQKVNTGDVIGYSGNSGYSIGPHLHLTVYASQAVTFKDYKCRSGLTVSIPVAALNAYLNPLDYL